MGEFFPEETKVEEAKEISNEEVYLDMVKFDSAFQAKIKEINENIGLQIVRVFGAQDKRSGELVGGLLQDVYDKIDRPELRQLRLSYLLKGLINEMNTLFQSYRRLKVSFEEYIEEKEKYVETILQLLKEKDSNIEAIKQEAISEARLKWEEEGDIKPKEEPIDDKELKEYEDKVKEKIKKYNDLIQAGCKDRKKLGFAKGKAITIAGRSEQRKAISYKLFEELRADKGENKIL